MIWSDDILNEYIDKMKFFKIPEDQIVRIISQIIAFGEKLSLKFYHYELYPRDAKDICFVLCALNGMGSHIVTYDIHLLELRGEYWIKFQIKILKPRQFLSQL